MKIFTGLLILTLALITTLIIYVATKSNERTIYEPCQIRDRIVNCSKIEIKTITLKGEFFGCIKYNTISGMSWILIGSEWQDLADPTPLDQGHYEMTLTNYANSDTFAAVRWDVETGKSWLLEGFNWKEILNKRPLLAAETLP